MAVMIITVSVVGGFKHEIYKKLIGFQSHITIKNRDINNTFESEPVSANQVFYPSLEKESGISHIQRFATKLGIVKAETEVHGVVLKGAGKDYDWSFLKTHLTEGKIPDVLSESKTKDLLISQKTADILNYKTGDKVFIYFIQNPPKARDFIISGIYDTGMEEYDKAGVFCDIRHIQKINDWDENQVSGFEVFIDNFDDLNNMTQLVEGIVSGIIAEDGSMLQVSNFMKDNSFFVQWLKLSDMNVQVILLLMIFVAVLSMIAAMLTIILERTNMIGILKALGANNYSVIRIFIYNGSILILKGMFYGNLFGLIILMIQKFYKLIPLDSKLYYVDSVPVEFNVLNIVLLNAGVFIISALFLILPAILAAKINPVKTINFK